MISSLAMWLLTVGVAALLGVGLYLLAWHRGYLAGLDACGFRPLRRKEPEPPDQVGGRLWVPPSEGEFMSELLEDLRQNEPPQRYRRQS